MTPGPPRRGADVAGVVRTGEPPDLRLPLLALGAWAGGLVGRLLPWPVLVAAAVLGALVVLACRRRSPTALALVLVFAAVGGGAVLRHHQVAASPVSRLAHDRAVATVELRVTSDPRPVTSRYGDRVLLRATTVRVGGRGEVHVVRAPVLVLADDPAWLGAPLGATVRAVVRLGPADEPDLAAVAVARGSPRLVLAPDVWWRGASAVRASVRAAVEDRPPSQAALVPALVDGDDAGVDPDLAADFRATGLTHLLAVSGTNLTLVVGFLLVVARGCGARGRWLLVVGAVGIVGFVLLARTEPSVVRAAAMGAVGLFAMGPDGRRRGARALGAATVALLLVAPDLAVSVGFALSVSATGGIVLLAPAWRDALARWLPRWAAEAVAVPATAQLACTPLVAAISGQVSLVAVAANLLVAPAVGPATVLGLGGGLVGLLWPPAGRLLGVPAGLGVGWIVTVARAGADLPGAAVGWATGVLPLALLCALALAVVLGAPRLLRTPVGGALCCGLLVVAVLVRPGPAGWPPEGWLLAACDVGQGDALAVRVGETAAIVVDAGPDPSAVDGCLDRLAVRRVPLLVLTHFHADHVDGLAGVLDGREVGAAVATPVRDPAGSAADVERTLAAEGLRLAPAGIDGGVHRVGTASLQVLWPGPSGGRNANDSSVVLLVVVDGVRLLLTGDIEPPAQQAIARTWPDLAADVLKVPHHGSRHQDSAWLTGLGADVALVSAGADNDYGHPAESTLEALARTGARVLRTDTGGDLVVVRDDRTAGLATVTAR